MVRRTLDDVLTYLNQHLELIFGAAGMEGSLIRSSKVPKVTLGFWVIKIAATTLGETGGDSVTMTFKWGYLDGTALFLGLLIVLVVGQILSKKFHSVLYWATIVA